MDHSNREAVCAALVVKEQLKVHLTLLGHLPHLLAPGDHLPERTKTVLVTCSSGCFLQPTFVKHIIQAAELGASVVPINCGGGRVLLFCFLSAEGVGVGAKGGGWKGEGGRGWDSEDDERTFSLRGQTSDLLLKCFSRSSTPSRSSSSVAPLIAVVT